MSRARLAQAMLRRPMRIQRLSLNQAKARAHHGSCSFAHAACIARMDGRGVDVVAEAEHADDGVEVATPLRVVAGEKVQRDGNVATDVHRL